MATSPKSSGTAAGNTAKPSSDEGDDNPSIERLEADIRRLREDVAALTRHLKESGDETYKSARKAATEGAEQFRAQGEAAMENLRDNAEDVSEQVADAVRRKPITSLAIAAGVGYLLAMLRR